MGNRLEGKVAVITADAIIGRETVDALPPDPHGSGTDYPG